MSREKSHKRRYVSIVLTVCLSFATLLSSTPADAATSLRAKSALSPLKIPAVTGRVFQKTGRP